MYVSDRVMGKINALNPIVIEYMEWPMARSLGVDMHVFFIIKMLERDGKELTLDNVNGFIDSMGRRFKRRVAASLNGK